MKKLLTLVLGVVLFSGAAYAKLYWLPDYQNEDMKAKDRVFDDDSNRTSSCSQGGYYNSSLGSCYNCSRIVYAHQVCYSCTPKSCPSGQVTKAACYAQTNGSNGWNWTSSGACSGTETCGTCTAKTCDSSYQTSAALCGTTGASGWTLDTNNKCYAGATTKYKCVAKSCLSGYSTAYSDVSKCGSTGSKGWSWEKSSQYAGNSVCGKCTKLSCNSPYISGVKECSPSAGYNLKQDNSRYNGDTVCGYCQANDCTGTPSSVAGCGATGASGWNWTSNGCQSGTTPYGTCSPKPCASGVLQNACGSGYTWSANGCYSGDSQCGNCKIACTGVTSVAQCGTTGASGYNWVSNGCNANGQNYGTCSAKTCKSGYTAGLSSCSNAYDTVERSGYAGEVACGRCTYKCSISLSFADKVPAENPGPTYWNPVTNSYGSINIPSYTIPAKAVYNWRICEVFDQKAISSAAGQDTCGFSVYRCSITSTVHQITNHPMNGTSVSYCYQNCDSSINTYYYPSDTTLSNAQRLHDRKACYTACNTGYYQIGMRSGFSCPNGLTSRKSSDSYDCTNA